MTDLERVKKVLEMYGAEDAIRRLDTHLKEDAERDRALAAAQEAALTRPSREREVIAEMDDELAKLREERDEAERRAQVNLEDANRGWAENARLREEKMRYAEAAINLQAQRDTLLAALKKIEQFGKPNAYALTIPRDIARRAIAEIEVKP